MGKDRRAGSSYRDLLEGVPLQRSDPFDSIVTSHLQARGGSPIVVIIAVLLIGAIIVPPLWSLLSLF